MTQSTILALGTAPASSADVVLAAGEVATLSIFHAAGQEFGLNFAEFPVVLLSPGEPVRVGLLDATTRITQVFGPGTYQVQRPQCPQAFGVAKDI